MAGLLFAGGAQTTTQMIGSGLLLLLRHHDQLGRLIDAPELIPSAVDELLRFESPITLGLIRHAADDISVGDISIPRGDLVFVGVASANHDERRYSDPERSDVTRQENPHRTFGHGPHYCLGASLARLELQTVLAALIEQYPTIRLACDLPMFRGGPSVLRGPMALPVHLGPATTKNTRKLE
ncbi:cytochrome P450 [Streptomyces mirabilis]|uniref:cytochrome P450 n=1 Tax=Streptomyces mirabilis TaxID=68239 RepID=UPI00331C027D